MTKKINDRIKSDRTKALLVYHYQTRGVDWTTRRYGISERSIYRIQKEVEENHDLSEQLQVIRDQYEALWAEELGTAIRSCISGIIRCSNNLPTDNPKSLERLTQAMEKLYEVQVTESMKAERRDAEIFAQQSEIRLQEESQNPGAQDEDQEEDDEDNEEEEETSPQPKMRLAIEGNE